MFASWLWYTDRAALSSGLQLNKEFQAEEAPTVILCISMQWFREWESFVKGKDNGREPYKGSFNKNKRNEQKIYISFQNSVNAVAAEPPGPIDNSKIGVMKGGHLQLKQGNNSVGRNFAKAVK